jgi:hypothetical protein
LERVREHVDDRRADCDVGRRCGRGDEHREHRDRLEAQSEGQHCRGGDVSGSATQARQNDLDRFERDPQQGTESPALQVQVCEQEDRQRQQEHEHPAGGWDQPPRDRARRGEYSRAHQLTCR